MQQNLIKAKLKNLFGICLFLISGTAFPILNNAILNFNVPWKNNVEIQFRKPWFQNCMMFVCMCVFLIFYFTKNKCQCKKETINSSEMVGFRLFRFCSIPSIIFIIATILQNYGLLYMSTTVWQLFHGFQLLFTTLFAVTYRKQQLFLYDWLGLFVTILGMCFAGVGIMLRQESEGEVSKVFIAFILVIFSHGLKGFQTILEEKLTHDYNVSPIDLIGIEGFWGSYITILICIPICNILNPTLGVGLYENTGEAFAMLKSSKKLTILLICYMITITIYSYGGVLVTSQESAVHRSLYELARPFLVWIASTLTYYITKSPLYGDKLDKYSAFELVGFGICVLGIIIYNRIWKLPCFVYSGTDEETSELMSLNNELVQENNNSL